jgi:hypothetical protein
VGWSELIRRWAPRTPNTVGVAASLVQSIVESTNALLERLAAEGFAWKDAARAQSDDCLLECTLFEWFLRDVQLMRGFGTSAPAVRQAVAGRLLIDLQRSGVSPACFHDFGSAGRTGSTSTPKPWPLARPSSPLAPRSGGGSRQAASRASG